MATSFGQSMRDLWQAPQEKMRDVLSTSFVPAMGSFIEQTDSATGALSAFAAAVAAATAAAAAYRGPGAGEGEGKGNPTGPATSVATPNNPSSRVITIIGMAGGRSLQLEGRRGPATLYTNVPQ